ncbi:chemotaxis protein CheX [Motilimonas sp. KMU-193]|uniref:chemotaxis protein CheX n=1 Tax=Motilimonas sp. KMU-193 TaxID=3388668 RepID=UPI00396B0D61
MSTQADFEAIVFRCWRHFCAVKPRPFVLGEFHRQHGLFTQGVLVELNPAKQGIVILTDEPVAAKLASVMFACPIAKLGQGQMLDALGEMANMIAGHVKSEQALHGTIASPIALSRQQIKQLNLVVDESLACALQLDSSVIYVLLGQQNRLYPAVAARS